MSEVEFDPHELVLILDVNGFPGLGVELFYAQVELTLNQVSVYSLAFHNLAGLHSALQLVLEFGSEFVACLEFQALSQAAY